MTSSSRDSKIVPCAMSGNMATLILKYQFLLSHCCLAKASWSAKDLLTPLTPFFWAKILMLLLYLGKPAKIDCSCTRSCKGFTGAKHLAKSVALICIEVVSKIPLNKRFLSDYQHVKLGVGLVDSSQP